MVFHWRLHRIRKSDFKVSHLCYAERINCQYQATVKLPGAFRLSMGNRHLHRYCIFTGHLVETVLQSLRLSCTSELTGQGITLIVVTRIKKQKLRIKLLKFRMDYFYPSLYVAIEVGLYLADVFNAYVVYLNCGGDLGGPRCY